jgi:hypothetical protein
MIYQVLWDTEQIGLSGITTEARIDRIAAISKSRAQDSTFTVPTPR